MNVYILFKTIMLCVRALFFVHCRRRCSHQLNSYCLPDTKYSCTALMWLRSVYSTKPNHTLSSHHHYYCFTHTLWIIILFSLWVFASCLATVEPFFFPLVYCLNNLRLSAIMIRSFAPHNQQAEMTQLHKFTECRLFPLSLTLSWRFYGRSKTLLWKIKWN